MVDGLARAMGAQYDATNDLYVVDCAKKSGPLVIGINGKTYGIDPSNFLLSVSARDEKVRNCVDEFLQSNEARTMCVFTIFSFKSGGIGPSWILGDPFIRQYCNIYDVAQKRIGFACPKGKSCEIGNYASNPLTWISLMVALLLGPLL